MAVCKLDRLRRNTRNLLTLIDDLECRGIRFRGVTEPIGRTQPIGKAMLTIVSAFEQLERDQLAERTRAGMAGATGHCWKAGRREITAGDAKV